MTIALRPIRTQADYEAALAEAANLMGAPQGSTQSDQLAVLSILIAEYERGFREAGDPLEALRLEISLNGRSQSDLAAVLGSRSRASEVLSGRRPLSAAMADKVAKAWSVPRALLGPASANGGVTGQLAKTVAASFALICGALSGTWMWATHDLPDTAPLVAAINAGDVPTRLTDIPLHVRQAFLAAEDADFYLHDGANARGIMRAALHNVALWQKGRRPAGGTGITEQLVKNTLLKGQPKSLKRRIQQFVLARDVEGEVSKDQIFERYLNIVNFGGSHIGIAAASNAYFNTATTDLTVAQAAALAALPAAPTKFRPDRLANQDRAKARQKWVLERMSQEGFLTAELDLPSPPKITP